ncbi:MAG: hypothetical protein QXM68_03480 [Candidatus Aenigmatarchaeota archaeon]|nr:hypothetical protein [Candidatus Aenigmarchaeota archaeon]
MKGYLNYLFYSILFFVFVVVSILIIRNISKSPNNLDYDIKSEYFCNSINNTVITKKEFQDILTAFINGDCTEVIITAGEPIEKTDIQEMVREIDENIGVFEIKNCDLFSYNSGNIFANFTKIQIGEKIYLNRKQIMNSDILVCAFEN